MAAEAGRRPAGASEPHLTGACERYVTWLAETFGEWSFVRRADRRRLRQRRRHRRRAAALFERLGESVHRIGSEPDGRNINAGVGSTHLDAVAGLVRGTGRLGWRSTATPIAAWASTPPAGR